MGLPVDLGLLLPRDNLARSHSGRAPVRLRPARAPTALSALAGRGVVDDGDICRELTAWRRAGRPTLLSGLRPAEPGRGGGELETLDPTILESSFPGTDLLAREVVTYRAVEFSVPRAWYLRWLAEYAGLEGSNAGGVLVSSVSDCLAGVWPELTAAARAHRGLGKDNIDGMLGCYALSSVADRSFFWREGDGSHRAAWRTMVRMIVAYADGIEDEFQPRGGNAVEPERCEGFGDFARSLFQNRLTSDSQGTRCRLTVHFDATDARFERSHDVACGTRTRECGRWAKREGDGGEEGRPFDYDWDDWDDGWDEASRTYLAETGLSTPEKPASYNGYSPSTDSFQIVTHPTYLAWSGFLADRILHRARIAWDYYQFTGDREYQVHAVRLGRYALSVLTWLPRLFIHEIGHIYMGQGGHCQFGCCFEIAARAWYCHVVGRLGLPLAKVTSRTSAADFSSGVFEGVDDTGPRELEGTTTPFAALAHEFGGGWEILANSNGGGACDSEVYGWWTEEGVFEYGPFAGFTPDPEDPSDGMLCWTCEVETAGRAGGNSSFCLRRAWQTYVGSVYDPRTGAITVAYDTDEWTLEKRCVAKTSEQQEAYLALNLWCAGR
ncbi:hypothetical protein L6R53_32800 [Myxococcota bacterium]|nr:hypothetical protein [Myxococcota bacterium]